MSSSPPEPKDSSNLFSKMSTFLTVFAGLASLIYVLGLFSLWVPIAKTYTQDFHMSWHAVSLVPRIVVAGLGIEQFVAFPLLLMVLTFSLIGVVEILLVVLRSIHGTFRGQSRGAPETAAAKLIRDVTIFAASVATAWGYIAFYAGWHIRESLPSATTVSIFLFGLGFFSISLSVPFSVAVCSEREQALSAMLNDLANDIAVKAGRSREPRGANAGLVQNQSIKTLFLTLKPKLSEIVDLLVIFLIWVLISCGVWFLLGMVAPWVLQLGAVHISSITDYVIFIAVALLACVAAVYTAIAYTYVNINNRRESLLWFLKLDQQRTWIVQRPKWHGIAVFALPFLMALLLTFLRVPPLPIVEVNGDDHAEGRLLAHTEGFWYVFSGEEGELLAISDSKVSNVEIRPIDEENRRH